MWIMSMVVSRANRMLGFIVSVAQIMSRDSLLCLYIFLFFVGGRGSFYLNNFFYKIILSCQ